MLKRHGLLALTCFWTILACCEKQPADPGPLPQADILEQLQSIEDIEVTEITPANGYSRQFEIVIVQPLDHNNPQGAHFEQRIYLSHTGTDNPMVFMPSGYSSSPVKKSEISDWLQANQIYIAHRFMLGAEPDVLDWQFLTIEQASADFHHVAEVFKNIYSGPWISYGRSKNGQAALYHRRFYPDDVAATVVVGSALSQGTEDPRYKTFLEQVGSAADRERIKSFQKTALEKKDQVVTRIESYMFQSDFQFTRMTADEILEFEVLEFPFGFWQTTDGDFSIIPDSNATAQEIYNFMADFGYFDVYSDEMLDFYAPVYYQAYTELGWYPLVHDHLDGLLTALDNPSNALLAPQDVALVYNGQVMQDIISWLETNGNNIIYIYGENDPWSAGALASTGATNALKIVQPGANHSVKISELDQASQVYSQISQWLDIPADN